MTGPRRFPKPWTVEELPECFIVRDTNGFPMAYLYYDDDFKRNFSVIGGKYTKDEARRVANAIARLPDLLTLEKQVKSGALGQVDEV